ncbi:MAG: LLM class flavin-dependent oxidoreductase [Pseudomonadales bacterium]|nr:LLM class flavin-dependent oxidoreductase [Pseudomonadales bacterium]
MSKSFSCYLIGGQSLLIQCGDYLLSKAHNIKGVITKDPEASRWAIKNGIEVFDQDARLLRHLADDEFDYLFSLVNLSITADEIISAPTQAAINFHDGILPDDAGLNVTTWAILNGATEHGVTFHRMLSEVDKGEIFTQKRFPISESETSFTLNAKCFEVGYEAFVELISNIELGELVGQQQDTANQKYYGGNKRPKDAAFVDWHDSTETILNLLRAMDFGPGYPNPMCTVKIVFEDQLYSVGSYNLTEGLSGESGEILDVCDRWLTVATSDGAIKIGELKKIEGEKVSNPANVFAVGKRLVSLSNEQSNQINELLNSTSRFEKKWYQRLESIVELETPFVSNAGAAREIGEYGLRAGFNIPSLDLEEANIGDWIAAASCVFFARLSNTTAAHIPFGLSQKDLPEGLASSAFSRTVPFFVQFDPKATLEMYLDLWKTECSLVQKQITYSRDIINRYPALTNLGHTWRNAEHQLALYFVDESDELPATLSASISIVVNRSNGQISWYFLETEVSEAAVTMLVKQFEAFLKELAAGKIIGEASLLSAEDRELIFGKWADTFVDVPTNLSLHQLFESSAQNSPNAPALAFRDSEWTYEQLNSYANQVARFLVKRGVQVGDKLGVLMARSDKMIATMLAILKCGAAYIPLDPDYPHDRIGYMIEDSNAVMVLTDTLSLDSFKEATKANLIDLSLYENDISQEEKGNLNLAISSDHLAYMIYTSGSTGKPKGVMVEHRNVVNFFYGMDRYIDHEVPGVWLSVTSISFDISVLEIFWSLSRGFKLVVFADQNLKSSDSEVFSTKPDKKIAFSLFFWNHVNEADKDDPNKYRLLMEAAKFGDENGFEAVWTPERHFGSFGGSYPNPSVISAALAVSTSRIKIRAGSCVLPLHSPIRVAEEWSVVDNLSNGRVGLAFASGWQPKDFAILPGNHARAKDVLFESMDKVRSLWKGEKVEFETPVGTSLIETLPRPIQSELPVWITSAGNPDTFRKAGEAGAGVLTHLLGQTVDDVSANLKIYREAWKNAGHPGEGYVTLMLHTLVGDDDEQVKESAREPMKGYLKSAMSLVRDAAWHFPTFKKMSSETGADLDSFFDNISPEDLDGLLEFAFERYYGSSGLFGSQRKCMEMVDSLKEIGVDEIGCLIDYGIDNDTVLKHLPGLARLVSNSNKNESPDNPDFFSIPKMMQKHGVTHFQCTPSQSVMLTSDSDATVGLGNLSHFMVGGEALSLEQSQKLVELVGGKVTNMYGPTETTIWSAVSVLEAGCQSVSIGKPIANTQIYIVDDQLQPLPVGVPGELVIGGLGVVRGYHERPELTADRFLNDTLAGGENRLYRTGDRARYLPDGSLEYLGRMDFQVKIRGYRVELGEIESLLSQQSGIKSAVVTLREDTPGDQRLVAYYVPEEGANVDDSVVKESLARSIPEFMVPSLFVELQAFPLTPNGKIDRRALPAPVVGASSVEYVAPEGDVENQVVEIWKELLGVEQVGVNENFFEIGGHSLLAVQVLNKLRSKFSKPIQMTDLFRFTTVKAISDFIANGDAGESKALDQSQARAEARKASMNRRRRRK